MWPGDPLAGSGLPSLSSYSAARLSGGKRWVTVASCGHRIEATGRFRDSLFLSVSGFFFIVVEPSQPIVHVRPDVNQCVGTWLARQAPSPHPGVRGEAPPQGAPETQPFESLSLKHCTESKAETWHWAPSTSAGRILKGSRWPVKVISVPGRLGCSRRSSGWKKARGCHTSYLPVPRGGGEGAAWN